MAVKLTRAVIDALPAPEKGERLVRDAELRGFGVRVTAAGSRSYFVERKVAGRTKRITISRCDLMPIRAAREAAIAHLAEMQHGTVPSAPAKRMSLQDVLDAYLAERASRRPAMKPRTAADYRKHMRAFGPARLAADVADITEDVILALHADLTKRGPTSANSVMRVARAILNHAVDLDLIQRNPVAILKRRRLWNREQRKTRRLDEHTLPAWWRMLDEMPVLAWPGRAEVQRDLWRLMLLTGMRYEEAGRLRVAEQDLERGLLRVKDTKNREDLELPVGRYVWDLLRRRCAAGGEWVFPAPLREAGHIAPGHDIRRTLIVATGLEWSNHDLRRTFASVLESFDVSSWTIKRLLGHRLSDVTAGYVSQDVERLRAVAQRFEGWVMGVVSR